MILKEKGIKLNKEKISDLNSSNFQLSQNTENQDKYKLSNNANNKQQNIFGEKVKEAE